MRIVISVVIILLAVPALLCQSIRSAADSIRKVYAIPELAYAVMAPDSILELQVLGEKQVNTGRVAELDDHFKIGSNTKGITAFIAALLVKQGVLSWRTQFFGLFPEWKEHSRKEYYRMTLQDLLSLRSPLPHYTYTDSLPTQHQVKGSDAEQRMEFAKYFLAKRSRARGTTINLANPSYVLAALMLEKASGKSYRSLVSELGQQLGVHFGFGYPQALDSTQPSGHNEQLQAVTNLNDYKLNWLEAAGNIHLSLADYTTFIQALMMGLHDRSPLLSKKECEFLLFGPPDFALGWFHGRDKHHRRFAYNEGNPGSFLSRVYVYDNRSYILLANIQSDTAEAGLDVLYEVLRRGW